MNFYQVNRYVPLTMVGYEIDADEFAANLLRI